MSIRQAILGFLSWKPSTGYELKRLFSDALSSHWSGNNNQIYGTLVQLHKDGAVVQEIQVQEKLPARKLYSLTEAGRAELRAWLLSEPELPALRSDFSTRLTWGASLSAGELGSMVGAYRGLLEAQVAMCAELRRRGSDARARSPLEARLWRMVEDHAFAFYRAELEWVQGLASELETEEKTRGGES